MVAYRAIDGIAGGLEKMSNALMNELCARGYDVHFYTLDNSKAVSYYEMHESITWHKLNIGEYKNKASLMTRIKRQLKTYKILKDVKPDIILAFQHENSFFFMSRPNSFMRTHIAATF
jgi:UDP-N-acetylglucosamine:LPS N-acetylglucosamine transferase